MSHKGTGKAVGKASASSAGPYGKGAGESAADSSASGGAPQQTRLERLGHVFATPRHQRAGRLTRRRLPRTTFGGAVAYSGRLQDIPGRAIGDEQPDIRSVPVGMPPMALVPVIAEPPWRVALPATRRTAATVRQLLQRSTAVVFAGTTPPLLPLPDIDRTPTTAGSVAGSSAAAVPALAPVQVEEDDIEEACFVMVVPLFYCF